MAHSGLSEKALFESLISSRTIHCFNSLIDAKDFMAKKKTLSDRDLFLNFDFPVKNLNANLLKEEAQLKIVKRQEQKLSKNQLTFNKLIKQIEALEKQTVKTKKLAFELTIAYSKEILPVEEKLGKAYFEFATFLDNYVQNLKLTKKQDVDFVKHMIGLCDTALTYTEPDEHQEALFDKYSEVSYKETLENEKVDMFEQFRDYMESEMGVEVGDLDFDIENEEEALKYAEKLREQLENKQLEEEEKELNKKKTKKQIEQEQKQKLEEELSTKSLRSIYISLAKMLHPDTETNEEQKLEKTELMKKVTVAYDEKDLATLLKLEMEWVHHTSDNLQALTDEKLKLYNKVLSEQVEELNQEIFQLKMNPAYVNIFDLLDYSPAYAHKCLKYQKDDLLLELEGIKKNKKAFQKQPVQKQVLIKYLKEASEFEDEDDDVFGEFLNSSLYFNK